jgi:hypothetical protein
MTEQASIPATAAAASEKLGVLEGTKGWTDKLLAGDAAVTQEWNGLHERVVRGDDQAKDAALLSERVKEAMTGDRRSMPDAEAEQMNVTAAMLRELGIRDEVVTQALSGRDVTQAEFDVVKNWQTRAMRDPEFTKRYLTGEPEACQKMTLAAIVLSSNIKTELRNS